MRWWSRWAAHWQARSEAAALARRPIPPDLWKRTLVRYPFLRHRDDPEASALRRLVSLFLDRKEFTAVGGLRLTDAMVVSIAAQACLPVLKLGLSAYDGFVGIVVCPDPVLADREVTDEDGVVHQYQEPLAGEAWAGGPVMLSWRDVRAAGLSHDGAYCVVIHEFAHVLDLAQGPTEALPQLPAGMDPAQWRTVMEASFQALRARVLAQEPSSLDPYGAESLAEFFAVAVESFFVNPAPMKNEHPDLYRMLALYFQQDPDTQVLPRRGQ